MFGAPDRDKFLKRLLGPRPIGFVDHVKGSQSTIGHTNQPTMPDSDGAPKAATRARPDMILAEDAPSFGAQIEEDYIREGSLLATDKRGQDLKRPLPQTGPGLGEAWNTPEGANRPPEIITRSPGRQAMRRKLNHLQIQAAAELLKAKLEAELKIEKERRGGQL